MSEGISKATENLETTVELFVSGVICSFSARQSHQRPSCDWDRNPIKSCPQLPTQKKRKCAPARGGSLWCVWINPLETLGTERNTESNFLSRLHLRVGLNFSFQSNVLPTRIVCDLLVAASVLISFLLSILVSFFVLFLSFLLHGFVSSSLLKHLETSFVSAQFSPLTTVSNPRVSATRMEFGLTRGKLFLVWCDNKRVGLRKMFEHEQCEVERLVRPEILLTPDFCCLFLDFEMRGLNGRSCVALEVFCVCVSVRLQG